MRKPRLGDLTQPVQSPPTKWRGQVPAQISLVPGLVPSERGIAPHVPWDCRHLSRRAQGGLTGALSRRPGHLSALALLSLVIDRSLRELWPQLLIQLSPGHSFCSVSQPDCQFISRADHTGVDCAGVELGCEVADQSWALPGVLPQQGHPWRQSHRSQGAAAVLPQASSSRAGSLPCPACPPGAHNTVSATGRLPRRSPLRRRRWTRLPGARAGVPFPPHLRLLRLRNLLGEAAGGRPHGTASQGGVTPRRAGFRARLWPSPAFGMARWLDPHCLAQRPGEWPRHCPLPTRWPWATACLSPVLFRPR